MVEGLLTEVLSIRARASGEARGGESRGFRRVQTDPPLNWALHRSMMPVSRCAIKGLPASIREGVVRAMCACRERPRRQPHRRSRPRRTTLRARLGAFRIAVEARPECVPLSPTDSGGPLL